MSPKLTRESVPGEGISKFVRVGPDVAFGDEFDDHCEIAAEQLGVEYSLHGGQLGYYVDHSGFLNRRGRRVKMRDHFGTTRLRPGARLSEERQKTARIFTEITGMEVTQE